MYAFRIARITHLTPCRQNGSLCGKRVSDGIEISVRHGLLCHECCRVEREAWVHEWHRLHGILGPINPAADSEPETIDLGKEKLVA